MSFKVVGFKMPQELSDRIDECVAHLGVQRTAWVRTVLANALKDAGFPVDPEILRPKQGARNDLPNRTTEAEKRARKAERKEKKKAGTFISPPLSRKEIEAARRDVRRLLGITRKRQSSFDDVANSAA